MKIKELRKLIKEELHNSTDLGKFGQIVTSFEELIQGESYNIYNPHEEKWYWDYIYNGKSPVSPWNGGTEYIFNPQDLSLDNPTWTFDMEEIFEWLKKGFIAKS